MFNGEAVRCAQLALLLAAVVGCVQVPDLSLTLTNERTTIERTYELTKYLEHQLKDIKDTYLSYLGPPFSDPDFSPPRPNSSSLSVPSAATRVELWRGLENGARLAQNQRAYRVLLCAMRELARSTLCPYLQSSLLHFCSGLNGLLGSITGLMRSLGYAPPPQLADAAAMLLPPDGTGAGPLLLAEHRASPRAIAPGQHSPAPLRAQQHQHQHQQHPQQHPQRHHGDHRQRSRDEQRHGGAGGGGGGKEEPTRRRERERERGERGRRGRRREEEAWEAEEDEEGAREGGMERWGRRRRLLSIEDLELEESSISQHHHNNNNNNNNNNNKYTFSTRAEVGKRERTNMQGEREGEGEGEGEKDVTPFLSFSPSSSSSFQPRRSPRSLSSLYSPTLPPSLSLLLQYSAGVAAGAGVGGTGVGAGAGVGGPDGGHSLLAAPLLSGHPTSNEFSRKVEGFWVLRELQSWLWRSAKDFNRLKKRLKA